MDAKTLGAAVRARREAAGLTQMKLARQIGVSQTAVSDWETNVSRPGGDRLIRLADALLIDPRELTALPSTEPSSSAPPAEPS